jgi:hypothetical protein
MPRLTRSISAFCVSGLAALAVAVLPSAPSSGSDETASPPSLMAFTILSGMTLSHTYTTSANIEASEHLTKPDDITELGGVIFVGFQNGVGPQGQPSSDGNTDSTIVAMNRFGRALAQWDIQGKIDGLTADAAIGGLIATVNEDANSSLYTITARAGGANVRHYTYNEPLPHNGGTDGISVIGNEILLSASAPGSTGTLPAPQPTFPAVYAVTLDPTTSIATVTPLFNDEDKATVANAGPQEGQNVALQLTDPDSSEVVPMGAPRFARDFMLDSQGDEQQIFVGRDNPSRALAVLNLSQAVDDTAWAVGPGVIYGTDSTNDAIDALGGNFGADPIVAVTPCGSNSAPATCPAPPQFPENYLGSLDPWTGEITPVHVRGANFVPQGGLVFVPYPRDGEG